LFINITIINKYFNNKEKKKEKRTKKKKEKKKEKKNPPRKKKLIIFTRSNKSDYLKFGSLTRSAAWLTNI